MRTFNKSKRRQHLDLLLLFALGILVAWGLVACSEQSDKLATAVATPTLTPFATAVPLAKATPLATVTVNSIPTKTKLPLPTHTPSLPPTAVADPYAPFTIEALAKRAYGGGELTIAETLEKNDRFTRYLITYPSDGLTIYGFMNVPHEGTKFPVALILHGYIPPAEYETIAYTTRYADALADAGYFVIHPNFRNYPPSDSGPDAFRTGFAVDILNLIAILRTQSQDAEGVLRRADADNIHLWGHSMGGGVALRVITVNNAPYLKAAVLYGSMSGDEKLNYERIWQWSNRSNGQFERAADDQALAAISPIAHLERIKAAISIHHSDTDERVPVAWSLDLCSRLEALEHAVDCFIYNGAAHTFIPPWDDVFITRVTDFFARN